MMMIMIISMVTMSLVSSLPNLPEKGKKGCPEPKAPARGIFRLSADEMMVEFFCQPGRSLIGDKESNCSDGVWSKPAPVCVGADCDLPAIRDSTMVSLHGGGIIRIQCRNGFDLHGESATLACIDGQWNDTKLECVAKNKSRPQKQQTKNAATPVGARHQSTKIESQEENSKKTKTEWLRDSDYSCLENDFTLYPPSVPNARSFTRWIMFEGRPRLYTMYQCKWGFKLAAGSTRKLYCQNVSWVGPKIKCETVINEEEPSQGDSPGVVASLSHEKLLLHADYSCISKYSIDPPSIENADSILKFTILEGKPHLYAEYVCNDGFKLAKHRYLYCKFNSWIGHRPQCISAVSTNSCSCDQLCDKNNRCSCKQGFILQPDDVTCADVDECEVNEGGCDHWCSNSYGSYECTCYSGYTLDSNRKSCTKI